LAIWRNRFFSPTMARVGWFKSVVYRAVSHPFEHKDILDDPRRSGAINHGKRIEKLDKRDADRPVDDQSKPRRARGATGLRETLTGHVSSWIQVIIEMYAAVDLAGSLLRHAIGSDLVALLCDVANHLSSTFSATNIVRYLTH